jgi:hypothetical protein
MNTAASIRDHLPWPPLEMVEAEFLLHLLMSLLAHPSRLDGGGDHLRCRVGRQIAEICQLVGRPRTPARPEDVIHLITKEIAGTICAAIGGVWRDVRDTDEHYVYSIALQNEP